MLRIKRTKKPPAPAMTPAAVHYATRVAPAGNIAGLTEDVAQAGQFDEATVAAVKDFYRTRENVGKLTFETVAEPTPAPEVPETPAAAAAQETPPSDNVVSPQPEKPSGRKAK